MWYVKVLSWATAIKELVQEDWDTLWRVARLFFFGLQFLHGFLRRCKRRFRSTAISSKACVGESACSEMLMDLTGGILGVWSHARSGMLSNMSHAGQAVFNFQVPRVQMSHQVAFLCHLCPILPPLRGQGCLGRLPTNGPHNG